MPQCEKGEEEIRDRINMGDDPIGVVVSDPGCLSADDENSLNQLAIETGKAAPKLSIVEFCKKAVSNLTA